VIGKLRSFARLPGATRALVIEAGTALMVGAALAIVPLRWYARWLGVQGDESPREVVPAVADAASRVGWAIRLIAGRVPFRSDCLPQAIAARILLGRRRLPVTVYFGAAFLPGKTQLEAHAWARCGAVTLTGSKPRKRFTTVALFAYKPKV